MQFNDIVGHSEIKNRLIASVKEGRISHAQLFLGKEGSGNLPMAIAYAQYISCIEKKENDSCGKCESCIKYEKLVHPDLHFVFPVATNKSIKKDPVSAHFINDWRTFLLENKGYAFIKDWQKKIETENKTLLIPKQESVEIIKTLSLKTYESEYKVMIIWHPERFNNSSANTLLKIIEEPPTRTLFVFVAHNTEQIIPTILSRTQLIKIDKINEHELSDFLVNQYQIENQKANKIALLSEGNYAKSIHLVENQQSDDYFYELFTNWMRMGFKGDVIGLIQFSEELSKIGREPQMQFLNYALHIFRESLIQNYGDDSLVRTSQKENQFLQKFAPFIHGANCLEIIPLFSEAIYHIERNSNPKILFLDVSLKITKLIRVKAPSF